jgi:hypothetical protein
MHLQDAVAWLEGNRFACLGDLRLEFRWPHALAFHVDSTGSRGHRAATTATTTAAPKPTTPAAVAAAAAVRLPLSAATTVPARRMPALSTMAALAALASLAAKTASAPGSPPLRHG